MWKTGIRDWLPAVLPAAALLLFRYAVKGLPPAAEVCLSCFLLAASAFWYRRKKRSAAFRLPVGACLLWTGTGIAFGILNRICFGKPADTSAGMAAFLLLCILGPATEEIVYRGLVYEFCLRFLPAAGAVLLNSLLFAAAHGSPEQMAVAFAAGVLFSFARKKTGTVIVPALMHIMANMAVFLF